MTTSPTQRPRRSPRSVPGSAALGAALLLLLLVGCGRETYEIDDVREVPDGRPAPTGLTLRQRLEFGSGDDSNPHGGGRSGGAGAVSWDSKTPTGWEPLPPSEFRTLGFKVPGSPDAECTFSLSGGTPLQNVDRWRKQMALGATDQAGVDALPRHPFLGKPALLVELEGTYVGMRGDKNVTGAKLLGLIAQLPETGAFLKMVGPASVVDAERERFFDLAGSIRMRSGSPPGSSPHGEGAPPPAPPSGARPRLQWTMPDAWEEVPAEPGRSSMRVVTFRPKGLPSTEGWLSLLPGEAGGVAANVNVWAGQVHADPPSAEEVAALPKGKVLGGEATYVTLDGKASAGEESLTLLGAIVRTGDWSVFVKLVGPTAEVHTQEAAFRAFTESLRE